MIGVPGYVQRSHEPPMPLLSFVVFVVFVVLCFSTALVF
jgi:hypothetical protein